MPNHLLGAETPPAHVESPRVERPPRPVLPALSGPLPSDANNRERVALRIALSEWLASARFREIDRHVAFYLPQVSVYFVERDVPRTAIRADKARLLGQAEMVEVMAGEPTITWSPDARRATVRFRKQSVIGGPDASHSGEVLQELV